MMPHYSKNISPDSLTGMVFAMEGIAHSVVLLNGPMGCKFYHSTTSEFLTVRPLKQRFMDLDNMNDFFFRQVRVPCTYLDRHDYVYGTADKVAAALDYLKESIPFDLLTVINSPGASLIGDDLKSIIAAHLPDKPCLMLESPGYSQTFASGYETATLELIKTLMPEKPAATDRKSVTTTDHRPTVNLLGLSLWQRYIDGDKAELIRLFDLAGITVNTCLCAGSSLDEIRRLPEADLNIVIYPEMGARTAALLRERCGTPCLIPEGPPIGFAATEALIREACSRLGMENPAQAFITDNEKKRAICWYKLNEMFAICGRPRGTRFSIEGDASVVLAYSRFFMDYLGMVPDVLDITDDQWADAAAESTTIEALNDLLSAHQAGDPRTGDMFKTEAELVFGNANTIAALKTRPRPFCGIEISLPGMGYTDIVPKTHLGHTGAMFLTEQVLNGLMSRL
ncbi:MAG: nitrogenase component 1 [Lachnospiraceae bacterium]|nr:nitrogenase component 1 [Lachnospiraceae bacterium]